MAQGSPTLYDCVFLYILLWVTERKGPLTLSLNLAN